MENKKAGHTPGPWEIQKGTDGTYYINAPKMGPGYYHVAHAYGDNAALIAAAPDMLVALEAQEAASSERSMTIYYQDSEDTAKTYDQKKTAHDNYLESAAKADALQDKATELRRSAIAKAKGE